MISEITLSGWAKVRMELAQLEVKRERERERPLGTAGDDDDDDDDCLTAIVSGPLNKGDYINCYKTTLEKVS